MSFKGPGLGPVHLRGEPLFGHGEGRWISHVDSTPDFWIDLEGRMRRASGHGHSPENELKSGFNPLNKGTSSEHFVLLEDTNVL